MRGRDIKKYGYEFADLWLINSHNGIRGKDVKSIEIDNYPAIKKHLDKFYPELDKRTDKGETPYNLRNCAYMEDFSKQKIIWKRIGSILRFSYDDIGCFSLDSTCFATGDRIKFLTAFFNSKIGNYSLKDSPKTGTGDLLISVQAFDHLYVPVVNSDLENQINELIDKLMHSRIEQQSNEYEAQLDQIFYNMYDFTVEEIALIKNS